MSILDWVRAPRHLLVLFLGTVVALLAGLGWLGWQSLQRERAVEEQRVLDQLAAATDLVAAQVRQNLGEIEEQLTRLSVQSGDALAQAAGVYAETLRDGAVLVVFADESLLAFPPRRLLYHPTLPAPDEPTLDAFAPGEIHEFSEGDPASAALYFADLARGSGDPWVRAGALLRLARNQRKAGRQEAALATYTALAEVASVTIGGRPADLVARQARCALLDELGRRDDLGREAAALARDLHSGRWLITRAAYEHLADETARWLSRSGAPEGDRRGPAREARSLTTGVDTLWERWRQDPQAPDMPAGRSVLTAGGRPLLLLWRSTADRLVALVAGPAFLSRHVVEPLAESLERQGVGMVLEDGEGRVVVSYGVDAPAGRDIVRTMAATRLPWTLRVAEQDPGRAFTQIAVRERLLLAVLATLVLLGVAGSYFSARAMTREIEAARLQSDFVAAVSHEFRTPLTLLRQFTDLLAEGRVSNEEERQQYYAALQRGTRRLTRLVENVLDFGRREAGSHRVALEALNARNWIGRVTAEFGEEARGLGYHIDFEWHAPADVVIQADESSLGRAVWNLLDNAVKYSPRSKTIWVTGELDGGSLTINVRDRGIGVPVEEQRAIFDKFVRGSTPAGSAVKGTGLGLALVKQIVADHHGEVRLVSAVGEGSTFSIRLPAQAALEATRAEPGRLWHTS
jgi:signal transduction histidine kinase